GAPPIGANHAPLARSDTASTDEDTAVVVNVLANDDDVDGDLVSITAVAPSPHGTAVIDGDRVRYMPAPDFSGDDTFTYTIGDGRGGLATASVTVTVRPVNDPPVAMDDEASTTEDAAVLVDVLANDTDPESG